VIRADLESKNLLAALALLAAAGGFFNRFGAADDDSL
jgi:hypothetical protein